MLYAELVLNMKLFSLPINTMMSCVIFVTNGPPLSPCNSLMVCIKEHKCIYQFYAYKRSRLFDGFVAFTVSNCFKWVINIPETIIKLNLFLT